MFDMGHLILQEKLILPLMHDKLFQIFMRLIILLRHLQMLFSSL